MSFPRTNNILILEVPTEAGTHWPGQSLAPKALQDAGLTTKLRSLGYVVNSISALAKPQPWQPELKLQNGVRGEETLLDCLNQIYTSLSELLTYAWKSEATPLFPIILGGPCSIEQAVIAALAQNTRSLNENGRKLGVLWIDSDADLTLPSETSALGQTAILDSMSLTHLTQRPGGLDSMTKFADVDRGPLVGPDNIVLFGLDVTQPKPEHFAYLLDNYYRVFTNQVVRNEPEASMESALDYLKRICGCDMILVHFDVDTVDSALWPLGNYPSYGGLDVDKVMASVKIALADEAVVALVVTEVNPNNDPTKQMLVELVDEIVAGFAARR